MSDRRIGHQAADVTLPESADIADGHREHGEDEGELPGELSRDRHGDDDEAQNCGDAGDLRSNGEKAGVATGCALIDVGGVKLEWRDGELEAEAGEDEHQ